MTWQWFKDPYVSEWTHKIDDGHTVYLELDTRGSWTVNLLGSTFYASWAGKVWGEPDGRPGDEEVGRSKTLAQALVKTFLGSKEVRDEGH